MYNEKGKMTMNEKGKKKSEEGHLEWKKLNGKGVKKGKE